MKQYTKVRGYLRRRGEKGIVLHKVSPEILSEKMKPEIRKMIIDDIRDSLKYKPQFPVYYLWENVGRPYGIRQTGRMEGYSSLRELMESLELKSSLKRMKEKGWPTEIWILKAVPAIKWVVKV